MTSSQKVRVTKERETETWHTLVQIIQLRAQMPGVKIKRRKELGADIWKYEHVSNWESLICSSGVCRFAGRSTLRSKSLKKETKNLFKY